MNILQRVWVQVKKMARYIWLSIWAILELPVAYFLEQYPPTRIGFIVKDNFPAIWKWLLSKPFIQAALSKALFRRFGSVTLARPHQATMAESYTSWKGIADLKFTGRHLPEDKKFLTRTRPNSPELVKAFVRPDNGTQGGSMIEDMRSTLLFASFAQWFTDSFLRTSHAFKFDKVGNVVLDENNIPIRKVGREKRNDSTHEIDLCQIYGLNEEMTNKLRCPDNKGCLRFEIINGEEFPERILERAIQKTDKKLPIKKHFLGLHDERILRHVFRGTIENGRSETLFATGLEHSNSTIGNALFNTVFLRQHNMIAREVAETYPDWDSNRVFETTRNAMIVILLNIVISDYISHISPLRLPLKFQKGVAEKETWYRRNRIHIEFNILYRWHGLVPSQFSFLPDPENNADFRHNNDWLIQTGVSDVLTVFSKERAGKMILGNTPRFLGGVKSDTVSIMRAAKLQPYNAYRTRFGLDEAKDFSDISDDPKIAENLSQMYDGKIDDVEWYIGMCAEKHGRGMIMGDLMLNMVAHDAFTHALTNPLLSNEVFNKNTFGKVGWRHVQEITTLQQVVSNVVDTKSTVCHFALNGEHNDISNTV